MPFFDSFEDEESEEKIVFTFDLNKIPPIMRKEMLKYIGVVNLNNASCVCKDWHRCIYLLFKNK